MISKEFFKSNKNSTFDQVREWDNKIDSYLGFEFTENESHIHPAKDLYVGANSSALQTSYFDYYEILDGLPDGSSFVDLGSGYSRANFVNAICEFTHSCKGLELVEQRVESSRKCGLEFQIPEDDFIEFDLMGDNNLPVADYYFIYLPDGDLFINVIKKLRKLKHPYHLIVIESHGHCVELLNMLDQWFTKIPVMLESNSLRHNREISTYKVNNTKTVNTFQYWFIENFENLSAYEFLIKDIDISSTRKYLWSAEASGSELLVFDNELHIQLETPKRLVKVSNIQSIREISNLESEYLELQQERLKNKKITKIIVEPSLMYELNGKRFQTNPLR